MNHTSRPLKPIYVSRKRIGIGLSELLRKLCHGKYHFCIIMAAIHSIARVATVLVCALVRIQVLWDATLCRWLRR
jgi:hypothetical protein